jgi:N4-gp56 family major capsid protein
MSATGTNSTTLDDLFVNIVAQARFTAEEQSLMLGLVSQYNIAGQAGKTVQIPKYPAVVAANLDEGTAPADTNVTTSSVSVTVAEVGNSVLLTDLAAMGAGNPADELGTVLGNAIATKIDKDLIALFSGFSTAVGTIGTAISVADLFKAAATLRNNKATGNLAAVVHPYQAYELKKGLTNTFANPNGGDLQNEAMRNGYVGSIAGIDVYESANIAVATDLGADGVASGTGANADTESQAVAGIFAPEALAIAMKSEFNLETQRNATRRGTELVATAVYGVAELDDTFGVKCITDGFMS